MVALEFQLKEIKSIVDKFQSMPQIPLSMHPGAEQGLPYELSAAYQRLTGQGIQTSFVINLLKQAQKEIDSETIKKPALVDAWIVRQLLNSVTVAANPTQNRYHVFMGPGGQGKTTSLVKFASHLVLKERKRIAIVSLDTVKVGAPDQMRIYAQILNVPFAVVRNGEEWRVAEHKLKDVQHILVDCPGLSLKTMEEAEWLKKVIPPAELDRKIHYVSSILARDEDALEMASRYQMIGFHDAIFTRIDESGRQGLIINFQAQFQTPLHSFSTGSRIPEDYEFASKERVIDFIFKLSRISQKEEAK
jgi:flagellar biosynthesis protein FlhF